MTSFATAFKCGPEAIQYAQTLLNKGMGYQGAARASGVNEATLREMLARPALIRPPIDFVRPKKRPGVSYAPDCATPTRSIIAGIAKDHGLTLADMYGCRVRRDISRVRQYAYREVHRQRPHLSYPEIGRIFGRDHSTIIHGIRLVEASLAMAEALAWIGSAAVQPDLFAEAA